MWKISLLPAHVVSQEVAPRRQDEEDRRQLVNWLRMNVTEKFSGLFFEARWLLVPPVLRRPTVEPCGCRRRPLAALSASGLDICLCPGKMHAPLRSRRYFLTSLFKLPHLSPPSPSHLSPPQVYGSCKSGFHNCDSDIDLTLSAAADSPWSAAIRPARPGASPEEVAAWRAARVDLLRRAPSPSFSLLPPPGSPGCRDCVEAPRSKAAG